MNSKAYCILIFDRSPAFAWGLARFLGQSNDMCLALATSSYEDFESSCKVLGGVDLVVINESLIREQDVFGYIESLGLSSGVRLLITESDGELNSHARPRNSKANGFISTNSTLVELAAAVNKLLPQRSKDMPHCSPETGFQIGDAAVEAKEVAFTPRQDEVYSLVLLGLSNKRIAKLLGISESTVKEHMTGILEKLGLKNRTEALVRARTSTIVKRFRSVAAIVT